jgi:hypothetical protein
LDQLRVELGVASLVGRRVPAELAIELLAEHPRL